MKYPTFLTIFTYKMGYFESRSENYNNGFSEPVPQKKAEIDSVLYVKRVDLGYFIFDAIPYIDPFSNEIYKSHFRNIKQ